ncbi:MAG: lipopolysaccharide heptosyltransferase II [Pseudomonadales bacterium]|nr:lipopolysaccharide heptosyltransferase II [Pseudomonadales bacterium]
MQAPSNRILVVGPAWVGDMVMSQVLFKHLKQRSSEIEIDVLSPRATVALVSRMAEVSTGIHMPLGHGEFRFAYRRGFGEQLKSRRYRQAIVLPNSWKSALVPFFADIPVRTGFRGEYRYVLLNDIRMMNASRLPRMVDRFVALGAGAADPLPEVAPPALMTDADNLAALRGKFSLEPGPAVLALCPGAEYGDAKQWPARHFAAAADHAVRQGYVVWILGGPNDAGIADAIRDAMADDTRAALTNLVGETSLVDAVDLLGAANLVISNDSGLMHIAAAVGTTVAVLYGSTSPAFTPPLSQRAHIFTESLACSPCFKRVCPLGHKNCLNGLLPSRLFDLVDQCGAGRS